MLRKLDFTVAQHTTKYTAKTYPNVTKSTDATIKL